MSNQRVVLIGAGPMAVCYSKILDALELEYNVVCQSEISANNFFAQTGKRCYSGGIQWHLEQYPGYYTKAIVAVGVHQLASVCHKLLSYRIKSILLEKPGGLDQAELAQICDAADMIGADIYIGYNRRFYTSVTHARDLAMEDGGVISANFEFTEWSHVIEKLDSPEIIKNNWFLANSTHVIDLAFHLIGAPQDFSAFSNLEIGWHRPAVFAGSGISLNQVLFTYRANWLSAGRWGLELQTRKRKLILQPLEKLYEQRIGTVTINEIKIDDELDLQFKPGLYRQTKAFIDSEVMKLKSIKRQLSDFEYYAKMLRGHHE
jgi:predicted dehydrogenase